jgi:hypothetical protein
VSKTRHICVLVHDKVLSVIAMISKFYEDEICGDNTCIW